VAATRIVQGELPATAADQLFHDSRLAILVTLVLTVALGLMAALVLGVGRGTATGAVLRPRPGGADRTAVAA
jgi:hypothetical protein